MGKQLYILIPVKEHPLWEPWFDKAFGFVVVAKSTNEARKLAASRCGDEGEEAWLSTHHSSCKLLKPTTKSKVIMRDFNAA